MQDFEEKLKELKKIDKEIHEPSRLLILFILDNLKECDFNFLLRETNLSKGNLSFHLYKLEEMGLIEIKKGFLNKRPHTVYRITQKGKKAFKEYKDKIFKIFK